MKRTNGVKRASLIIDEKLLAEATGLARVKTYSAAVEIALQDFIKRSKARGILDLTGSGLWEGDLSIMREDKPRRSHKP